jgi:hypothetical protein
MGMLESGTEICPRKKEKCERYGDFAACITYHDGRGNLSFCKRMAYLKKLGKRKQESV